MRWFFIFLFFSYIVYPKPSPILSSGKQTILFEKTHAQLRKQMESRLIKGNYDVPTILRFFSQNPPQTVQGWIRYGEILSKNSQNLLSHKKDVQQFWIESVASLELSKHFLRIWSLVLSQKDHEHKIIYLLSTSSPQNPLIQNAQSMLNLLTQYFHSTHELRIATGLMGSDARWEPFVHYKEHRPYFMPVLRRAYIRFLLRKNQLETACRYWFLWKKDLLSQEYEFNLQVNEAGFTTARALARDVMQKGNTFEASNQKSLARSWYTKAFDIIQTTFKNDGVFPIEQNWIGGLIQVHLQHWKKALSHFSNMMKQAFMEDPRVIPPMLRERYYAKAAFWCGVCAQKSFHVSKAYEYFEKAAGYPFLFYGQMAMARLKRNLTMKFVHPSTTGRSRVIEKVLTLLGDKKTYGPPTDAVSLVNCLLDDLIDNFSSVQECWAFVKILRQQFPSEAVYLARKLSAHRAQYVFPIAYPTCKLPRPFKDPALIWSIALGETCFSPYVVSSKGALGVMQIMPLEIAKYAKKAGLPYDLKRMKELNYGMSLGIEEIKEKLALYHYNYVLGIASYNAGARKLNEWYKTLYPVYEPDIMLRTCLWIERIPYEETRQYLCKILSFYCVYRWMQGRTLTPQDIEKLVEI